MVESTPSSHIGLLLKGKLEYEDANYASAVRWLRLAKQACETVSGFECAPSGRQPQWHALILHNLALVYTAMDRNEAAYEVRQQYARLGYDQFAGLNGITRPACCLLAENLVKLGRAEKALEILKAYQQNSGNVNRDGLLVVAESVDLIEEICSGDVDALFDKYSTQIASAEKAGNTPARSLLLAMAYYSEKHGDLDMSYSLYEKTVSLNEPWAMSNPWLSLSRLSIRGGRWAEAKDDLRECWQWTATKRQHVRKELQKEVRAVLAEFYLANGYAEACMYQIEAIRHSPLRSGFRLMQYSEQWEAGVILVEFLCDQMRTEQKWEARGGLSGSTLANGIDRILLCERQSERRLRFRELVARRLSRPMPIRDALEAINIPPWLWGDAICLLGPDVSRRLFTEYPLSGQRQAFYRKAVDVEIAAAGEEWVSVKQLVGEAVACLPKGESLWYARLQALRAKAEGRELRSAETLDSCLLSYNVYPAVFWRLGIPIPAVIRDDGSGVTDKLKACLVRTGRFVESESTGLVIDLRCESDRLECSLFKSGADNPIKTFSVPLVSGGADKRAVRVDTERINTGVLQGLFCGSELLVDRHDFDALEGRQVR